jgi:nucleotide-binding universal stress UspA family protein
MPFDRILVAIDGSQGARRALAKAIELAELTGATLTALAVEGPLPAYAATIGEVDEVRRQKDRFYSSVVEDARADAEAAGVEIDVELRPGHAAELITTFARDRGADLIVVGHRGHVLGDYLLGSTADRVAHRAHCPVIIVK